MKGALAAGAAGALLVLAAYSLAGLSDAEVFPWVESNQGFISVIALAIALTFAVIENHRANTATADRRAEFVATALAILDQVTTANATLRVEMQKAADIGGDLAAPLGVWGLRRARIRSAVETIRPSAPADGPLAIALADLTDALLLYHLPPHPPVEEVARFLVEDEDRIADVRSKIAARG